MCRANAWIEDTRAAEHGHRCSLGTHFRPTALLRTNAGGARGPPASSRNWPTRLVRGAASEVRTADATRTGLPLARTCVPCSSADREHPPEVGAGDVEVLIVGAGLERKVRMVQQIEELRPELEPLPPPMNWNARKSEKSRFQAPGPRNWFRPEFPKVAPVGWLNTDVSK